MLAYIAPGCLYASGYLDAIGVLALATTLMPVGRDVALALMRWPECAYSIRLASMATLPHTHLIELRSARLAHTSHRSAASTCLPDFAPQRWPQRSSLDRLRFAEPHGVDLPDAPPTPSLEDG